MAGPSCPMVQRANDLHPALGFQLAERYRFPQARRAAQSPATCATPTTIRPPTRATRTTRRNAYATSRRAPTKWRVGPILPQRGDILAQATTWKTLPVDDHHRGAVNEDPHRGQPRRSGRDALRERTPMAPSAKHAGAHDAGNARAHSILGHIAAPATGRRAHSEFAAVVALEPENSDAQNNLGLFCSRVRWRKPSRISRKPRSETPAPRRQNLEKARNQK